MEEDQVTQGVEPVECEVSPGVVHIARHSSDLNLLHPRVGEESRQGRAPRLQDLPFARAMAASIRPGDRLGLRDPAGIDEQGREVVDLSSVRDGEQLAESLWVLLIHGQDQGLQGALAEGPLDRAEAPPLDRRRCRPG